jgi:hypothetical protein
MPATADHHQLLRDLKVRLEDLQPHNYLDVELDQSKWCIARRPAYCDRGRFLWHCESKDSRILTIDHADGFPRYFFGAAALVNEMAAWCEARKQRVLSMSTEHVSV